MACRLSSVKLSQIAGAALLLCALPGLPATAKVPTAEVAGNKIKLEVASTREQITRGLMYRTSMPEDHGMVFLFRPPQAVKFWMAHCFISLDMLMIKDGKIVKIFENVQPERDKPEKDCPTYPSTSEPPIMVSEVVEVNGGYAKRHGIKEGDAVDFSFGTHAGEAAAAPGKTAVPAAK
jgi:uncharacterized membrane protein (UPF0127 family)